MKKKEERPIEIEILNPEALPRAKQVFTEMVYKAYMEKMAKEELNEDVNYEN